MYEIPEDEIESRVETVNESFWKKKIPPNVFKLNREIIQIFKALYQEGKITYNKWHIALGTVQRNCIWLRPRKSNYIKVEIKLNDEDVEDITNIIARR